MWHCPRASPYLPREAGGWWARLGGTQSTFRVLHLLEKQEGGILGQRKHCLWNLSSSVFDSLVMCPSLYHGCSRRVLLSTLHGSIRSEPGSICSEVILTSAASPPGSAAELGQVWSLVLYFQRDSDTPGGRPAPHQHLDQKGSGAGSLQGHRQHLQQLHANDPPGALGRGLRPSSAVRGHRAVPTPSFLNDFLEKYRW